MRTFEPLPVPAPIHCAWCTYQRGEPTDALVLPWLLQTLGQAPGTLGIQRDARGRPYLTGCDHTDINWSHSGGALLAAFGRGVRLGVDIEFQRPRRNALALAERFFTRSEAIQLQAWPEAAREMAFTRLWCAKEAVLKAHGHGISYGLDRLGFTFDGEDWTLTHCAAALGSPQDWRVHSLTPHPDYLAALAWRKA